MARLEAACCTQRAGIVAWDEHGQLVASGDLAGQVAQVYRNVAKGLAAATSITAPDGTSLVESYLIRGMGHAWPGPVGDGLYTDHAGPDASAMTWDFARCHPKS